jgi:UDP-N-acetylglucosamine 2-epimerase (non-hydrolysing)
MEKIVIDLVAGARPNFMKLAPVVRALNEFSSGKRLAWRIVHTGQHYDRGMNDVFFEHLGIPQPDVHLDVGSGTHGVQTAGMKRTFLKNGPRPRWCSGTSIPRWPALLPQ